MNHPFIEKLKANGFILAMAYLFIIATGHNSGEWSTDGRFSLIPYTLLFLFMTPILVLQLLHYQDKRDKAPAKPKDNAEQVYSKAIAFTALSFLIVSPPLLLRHFLLDGYRLDLPYNLFALLVGAAFLLLFHLQPKPGQEVSDAETKLNLRPDTPSRLLGILTALLIICSAPIEHHWSATIWAIAIANLALILGQTKASKNLKGTQQDQETSAADQSVNQ